nr:unnamed protein product [Callosobruchus chinensis]
MLYSTFSSQRIQCAKSRQTNTQKPSDTPAPNVYNVPVADKVLHENSPQFSFGNKLPTSTTFHQLWATRPDNTTTSTRKATRPIPQPTRSAEESTYPRTTTYPDLVFILRRKFIRT